MADLGGSGLVAGLYLPADPGLLPLRPAIILAWSLDRQSPEWIGRVNPRTNAPMNAIVVCALAAELILYLSSTRACTRRHALVHRPAVRLLWIMPGFNALFAKRRRPDLFGETSESAALGRDRLAGRDLPIYVTAIFKPIYEGLTARKPTGSFLRSSGILASLIVLGGRRDPLFRQPRVESVPRGVERNQVFATIPPD